MHRGNPIGSQMLNLIQNNTGIWFLQAGIRAVDRQFAVQ